MSNETTHAFEVGQTVRLNALGRERHPIDIRNLEAEVVAVCDDFQEVSDWHFARGIGTDDGTPAVLRALIAGVQFDATFYIVETGTSSCGFRFFEESDLELATEAEESANE